MRKVRLTLLSVSLLAACGNGGIGMVESPAWHMTASSAEKKKYYTEQCLEFGFKENTPEMAQCLQIQSNSSKSRASSKMDSALSDYNRSMAEASRRHQDRIMSPSSIRCRTYGAYTNCNAY